MDIETIKRLLRETGHTQRDLAAHLGVDPAAITRLLAGQRRLRLDEAPKVEAFFGIGPARPTPAGANIDLRPPGANVDLRPADGNPDPDSAPRDLPVYASAQGGPDGMNIQYEPVEWMRRPQALEGVLDAFAFYVVGGQHGAALPPWRAPAGSPQAPAPPRRGRALDPARHRRK